MKKLINQDGYTIYVSDHARKRQKQRNIDNMQIISCVFFLGKTKLDQLAGNDVLVEDKQNNYSVVFEITKNRKVNIITVIDKANCFAKNNTVQISK